MHLLIRAYGLITHLLLVSKDCIMSSIQKINLSIFIVLLSWNPIHAVTVLLIWNWTPKISSFWDLLGQAPLCRRVCHIRHTFTLN